jgi:hypothetical protein
MRIALFLLLIGGIFFYLGFQELRLSSTANDTPEEITLKKLIERGVEGNPHVVLSDFILGSNIVYSSRSGRWTKVWVPVIPFEGIKVDAAGAVRADNVQALLCSTHVANAQELETRLNQPKLKALVINKIASIGSKERELLKPTYPNIDFDKCLIIEEGREPAGRMKLLAMLGGGGAAFLAGGVVMVNAWRKR